MEINNLDCPKCGAGIPEQITRGKVFKCAHCGSTLVWPQRQSTAILSFGPNLCPDCGADNQSTRRFCRNCGVVLTKPCSICGESFYVGDSYCPNGHGFEQAQLNQQAARQEWMTTWLPSTLKKAAQSTGNPELMMFMVSGQFEYVTESLSRAASNYSFGLVAFKVKESDIQQGYVVAKGGEAAPIWIRAYVQPGNGPQRTILITCARAFPTLPIPPDWKRRAIAGFVKKLPASLNARQVPT